METRGEKRSYLLAEGDSQAESAFLQNRWPALEILMGIRFRAESGHTAELSPTPAFDPKQTQRTGRLKGAADRGALSLL